MRTQPSKTVTKNFEPATIHLVYLLDRSGSMTGMKYINAVKGIQDDLNAIGENPVDGINYTATIIEFSSDYVTKLAEHMFMRPIIKGEKGLWFSPAGAMGFTPLYESVGRTIERLEHHKNIKDKVLLNIFTDGGENTSRGLYSRPAVLKRLINRVEEEQGFTVTFQGTKGDIDAVVREVGIHLSNTLVHNNTAEDIAAKNIFRTASVMCYSKGVADGLDVKEGFYTKTTNQ